MATYFVANSGSNTAPYDTWAKAATSLQTALTAASTNGDVVAIDYADVPSGDNELAADTTYTFAANVALVASTNSGTSTITPTPMGTAEWIGNSTGNRFISIAGAFRLYFYGITFRLAGSATELLTLAVTDGQHCEYEECYLWQGNTGAASHIRVGIGDAQVFVKLKNTTVRFGNTAQSVFVSGRLQVEGSSVSSTGSAPGNFISFAVQDSAGSTAEFLGCDLSHCGSGNLVGDSTTAAATAKFSQCKLGSGYVMLATQTNLNRSSAEVYVFDCASGDTHGLFGYANAMGSVVSDTGIYLAGGAAAQSWKIVTTANCSFYTPFETPWFGYYNTGTSAITPYVEILRDGSATAYQDDEVWMDIAAKVTTTSTIATLYSDRMTLLGTAANQDAGAGLGSWTGESGTAWSGKLALGSSITPAENGHIQARIVVGEPSITVYADPQIRT